MAETTTVETILDADGFSYADASVTLTLKPKFTSTGLIRPDRYTLIAKAAESVLSSGIGDPANQTLRSAVEKQIDGDEARQALHALLLYAAVHASADTEQWIRQLSEERVWRAAAAEAEAQEAAEAAARARTEAAFATGRAILDDPALLYRVGPVCQRLRLAGEDIAVRLLYLAFTSRIANSPVNTTVKGNSSGGKSYTVGTISRLMPPSAFFELSAMTAKALVYSDEDFRHKFLVIYEQHGGEDADYIIRTLQSEGVIKYWTVEKGADGEMHTREIVKQGPTGFISTTTRSTLNEENETRQWDLWIDESPRQTKSVASMVAQGFNSVGASPDLSPWQAAQEWLGLVGATTANIGFSHWLAARMPDRPLRIRRDFGRLLTLIETSALMFQRQRVIEADGRVRATVHDYANASVLAGGLFAAAAQGLPARTRQLFDALVDCYDAKINAPRTAKEEEAPVVVSVRELMEVVDFDKQTIHRRLRPAIGSGVLENLEIRRGAEWKLVPHPELLRIPLELPDPEDLAAAFPELADGIWVHPLTGDEKSFAPSSPPGDSVRPNPAESGVENGEFRFEIPSQPEDRTESKLNQLNQSTFGFDAPAEPKPASSANRVDASEPTPGSALHQLNQTESIQNDSVYTHATEVNSNLDEPDLAPKAANCINLPEENPQNSFDYAAPPLPDYLINVASNADMDALVVALASADVVGLDTETSGLDPRSDRLCLLQFATEDAIHLVDPLAVDLAQIGSFLADDDGPLVCGHNLKFDLAFLAATGLPIPPANRLFDTYLSELLLDAGNQHESGYNNKLASLVERRLGFRMGKIEQTSDWWQRPLTEEQRRYAARDVAVLGDIVRQQRAELEDAELEDVFDLEMRTLPAVVALEAAGCPFDRERWLELSHAAAAERVQVLSKLEEEAAQDISRRAEAYLAQRAAEDAARAAAGKRPRKLAPAPDFNWNSQPRKLELLRARGHDIWDTTTETLQRIAKDEPIAQLLIAYSDATVRAGRYGAEFVEKHVHPTTGRIHADLHQLGSVAGRMSCSNPNLQNVPRDKAYRACFRPKAGRVLVKADFSQIELRIAAQLCQDKSMLEAYRAGKDLHIETAARVLAIKREDVTSEQRQLAKGLNFGLLYGAGAARLRQHMAENYGVVFSLDEAADLRNKFFKTYPHLMRWQAMQGNGEGETRTLTGRRRLDVQNYTMRLNSPVQGSGADLIKLALARLYADRAAYPTAQIVNIVHDEILVECDTEDAQDVRTWLTRHMEAAGAELLPDVPVVAEAHVMADWSGAPITTGGES
jgi:DNA polymerase-1